MPGDGYEADDERLALSDLVNRVLDRGVVIQGSVILSVAGIDLIKLDLSLVLSAVEAELQRMLRHRREDNADVPVLPVPGSG